MKKPTANALRPAPTADDVQRLVEAHYPGYRVVGKVEVVDRLVTTYRGEIKPRPKK